MLIFIPLYVTTTTKKENERQSYTYFTNLRWYVARGRHLTLTLLYWRQQRGPLFGTLPTGCHDDTRTQLTQEDVW